MPLHRSGRLLCRLLLPERYSQAQDSLIEIGQEKEEPGLGTSARRKTGTPVPEFPILKWAAAREDRMFARAMDYGRILGFDAWALSMLLGGFAVAGSLLLLLM